MFPLAFFFFPNHHATVTGSHQSHSLSRLMRHQQAHQISFNWIVSLDWILIYSRQKAVFTRESWHWRLALPPCLKGNFKGQQSCRWIVLRKWDGHFSCSRCLGEIKTKSNSGQNSFLADGPLVQWIHTAYKNPDLWNWGNFLRFYISIFSFFIQPLYLVGMEQGDRKMHLQQSWQCKVGKWALTLFFFFSIKDMMKTKGVRSERVVFWHVGGGIKGSTDS